MHQDNVNLLITQRHELIHELIALTKDKFYRVIYDIYTLAKSKKSPREYILRDFQMSLKDIASWNAAQVKGVSNRFKPVTPTPVVTVNAPITDSTDPTQQNTAESNTCSIEAPIALPTTQEPQPTQSIETLLRNIHVLNQQLFPSEVNILEAKENSLDLVDSFIHLACLNIAREIWRKAFFMYEIIDRNNYSQYYEQVENIITNAVKTTIRRQSNIDAICAAVAATAVSKAPYQDPHENLDHQHYNDHSHDAVIMDGPHYDTYDDGYREGFDQGRAPSPVPSYHEDYQHQDVESVCTEQALEQFMQDNQHARNVPLPPSRQSSQRSLGSHHSYRSHGSKQSDGHKSCKSISVASQSSHSSDVTVSHKPAHSAPPSSSSNSSYSSSSSEASYSSASDDDTLSTSTGSSSSSSSSHRSKHRRSHHHGTKDRKRRSKEKLAFLTQPSNLKYKKYHDTKCTLALMNQNKLRKLKNKFM